VEGGTVAPPGTTKEYVVTYLGKCEPTLQVSRPFAYVVPASYKKAIETLERHGISLEELKEDAQADVEVYRVDNLTIAAKTYQGHRAVTVETTARKDKRQLKAGDIIVRSDQALGTLAAFLLEPQSEDGLCTWNFFDAGLKEGADYPVLRVPAKFDWKTQKVR
jgi:dipeptidyl-peptidase 4